MTWFWVGYFSIGLWLLMPGIVYAWETTDENFIIKCIGVFITVLLWPLPYLQRL